MLVFWRNSGMKNKRPSQEGFRKHGIHLRANTAFVLPVESSPPSKRPRIGWAEASRQIAAKQDDLLVIPEFPNRFDSRLRW